MHKTRENRKQLDQHRRCKQRISTSVVYRFKLNVAIRVDTEESTLFELLGQELVDNGKVFVAVTVTKQHSKAINTCTEIDQSKRQLTHVRTAIHTVDGLVHPEAAWLCCCWQSP
jgi:hypothetical protein